MREPKPDIKVPINDQNELENSITREFKAHARLMHRGSWDTQVEAKQCEVNWDSLLDHWPLGTLRPDTEIALRGLEKAA